MNTRRLEDRAIKLILIGLAIAAIVWLIDGVVW